MPYFLLLTLLFYTFFLAPVYAQMSDAPTYYQDCSVLDFGEQDISIMTQAEKIQALDESFFGALNQSEECMNAAAQSSAQGVANAAGQSAGQGLGTGSTSSTGASAGQSNAQSSTNSQESSTNTQTSTSSSDTSKQSVGGHAQGGSSAVCDAVIAGLQGATTESEKAHFQALKEQYGCN